MVSWSVCRDHKAKANIRLPPQVTQLFKCIPKLLHNIYIENSVDNTEFSR